MELFGYPLCKHIEVFAGLFLFIFIFVITSVVRFLNSKKSLKHIFIGVGFSLINTVYFALVAAIFRAGRDFLLLISMIVGTSFILLLIYPYMAVRSKLESIDERL